MLWRASRPRSRAGSAAQVRTAHAASATMTAAAVSVRRSIGPPRPGDRRPWPAGAAIDLRTVEGPPGPQACQSGAGLPAEPQQLAADHLGVEVLRLEDLSE